MAETLILLREERRFMVIALNLEDYVPLISSRPISWSSHGTDQPISRD
jgi:hypothetical protein